MTTLTKIDSPCNISQNLLDAKTLISKLISLTACPTNINIGLSKEVSKLLSNKAEAINSIIEEMNNKGFSKNA